MEAYVVLERYRSLVEIYQVVCVCFLRINVSWKNINPSFSNSVKYIRWGSLALKVGKKNKRRKNNEFKIKQHYNFSL